MIYPRIFANALRISSAAPIPCSTFVDRLPHRALGVAHRVAERDERANRVVRRQAPSGRERPTTRETCRSSSLSARSRISCSAFFRPTRGTLCSVATSLSRIARTSRSAVSVDSSPSASDGPDALGVQHALKDASLERGREAEQLPRVFLHDEMRVQQHGFAGARQRLEHAERNRQLVGDAAGGHDLDAIELLADERSRDLCDHARVCTRRPAIVGTRAAIRQASAAATPSAASDGCGADLSRSSRVNMNCTCSLVAAPVPTTAFLISAGGSS